VEADRLLDLDGHHRQAVCAEIAQEIVGVARYVRDPIEPSAEIAVVVDDRWQRRGIGFRLLEELAVLARGGELEAFTMVVQADNRPALALLARMAPRRTCEREGGLILARVPLRPTTGGS